MLKMLNVVLRINLINLWKASLVALKFMET